MKNRILVLLMVCFVMAFSSCGNGGKAEDAKSSGKKQEESAPVTVDGSQQAKTIVAGCGFAAIREDGTVAESGCDLCDTSDWTDIVQITSRGAALLGLRADGTVVSTSDYSADIEASGWTGIVQLAGGTSHIAGLKADGTVITTSIDPFSGVSKSLGEASSWTDIVAISASANNIVGLKSDGTVVAAGIAYKKVVNGHDFVDIKFNEEENTMISEWTDIVAISASDGLTAGLKSDGTVVIAGDIEDLDEIKDWKGIVAIDANGYSMMGLKSDGSLIATNMDLSSMGNDFVAIDDGGIGSIMLKSDGTVSYIYDSSRHNIDSSVFKDVKFKL